MAEFDRRNLLLGAVSLALTGNWPQPGNAAEFSTLRQAAQARGIEIGAFTSLSQIQDNDFGNIVGQHFTLSANLLEEMEWDANPGFNVDDPGFSGLTAFLNRCRDLGLRSRARQIYSKEALPWNAHLRADGSPKNRTELEQTLVKRAQQACRPLKGRNAIIQVIDEILADHEGGLRQDPFSSALGEQYVDVLFHAAHEAAPDALLIYQEYGPEIRPQDWFKRKTKDYLALLDRLRKRNVPVTGAALGGFMHPDLVLRKQFFQHIEQLEYDIHITELTQIYGMRGEPKSDGFWPKSLKENDRIVADRYTTAFEFLCDLKRLREITFFAAIDGRNMVETGSLGIEPYSMARPGIFNYDWTPKPVYHALTKTVSKSKPLV